MEYISTQKFLLISPRKLRVIAALAKKMKPVDAVERLPFVGRKGWIELSKTIKAALASAKNKGESETDLVFKEIQIGEGPRLKRGRAVSRGQWHPIKKRMSHIRVILQTANGREATAKGQKNKAAAGSQKALVTTERSKHGPKS